MIKTFLINGIHMTKNCQGEKFSIGVYHFVLGLKNNKH